MASTALVPVPGGRVPSIHTYIAVALLTLSAACAPTRTVPSGPSTLPPTSEPAAPGGLLGVGNGAAAPDILGNASYDLPIQANSLVASELTFLTGDRRETVRSWLDRSDFYAEFVQRVFADEGIPTDLYHLGMIESGYVASARSSVGATGMWQFMPATSRDVGLRIDSNVDERMDPVRSTRAAARHLRSLFRIHGDWTIAAAAYNAGSTRIARSMAQFGVDNFWDLVAVGDLATETERYVPRLYAMTIIGRNRERYGFGKGPSTFQFDSVHVDFSLPLDDLAALGGVEPARLRSLNPHLINGVTPADGYWVWVPAGTASTIQRAYLAADFSREQLDDYEVRRGDALGDIALLSGVSSSRIRQLNPNVDFDQLRAGATIQLPEDAARTLSSRPAPGDETVASTRADAIPQVRTVVTPPPPPPPPAREPARADADAEDFATYTVRWGDTLGDLARLSGVSASRMRQLNPEIDFDRLQTGARLQLPADAAEKLADRLVFSEAALARPRPAPPPEPITHTVAAGESLWRIASRYGVTIEQILEANDLDSEVIRPGQRLEIPETEEKNGDPEEEAAIIHTVEAGESLWGIARQYETTVAAIEEANGLGARPIIPGQKLTIPN